MLSDFELITYAFPEREDITIIPIADVHLGSKECMEDKFISFINNVAESPNVYLVLAGDLINNATRNGVSNIFEERYRPADQKRMMAKILEPVRDRVLCAVPGNHEGRSGRDADDCPMYDIMCKLDIEDRYRENIAFVKIRCGKVNQDGMRNPTYVLAVVHGTGGGMLTGGAINRNERFGYVLDGVDCIIAAHTHKPAVTQPAKIKVDPFNNKVSAVPFKVITATSWLEYGGYAAKKMLLPASHSLQTVTLRGKHKEIVVTM